MSDTWESLNEELGGRMDADHWDGAAETASVMAETATSSREASYWLEIRGVCLSNAERIRSVT